MGHELADDDKLFLRASMMAELTGNLTILINGDYHEVDESTSIFRSLRSVLGGFIALESTNSDFYVAMILIQRPVCDSREIQCQCKGGYAQPWLGGSDFHHQIGVTNIRTLWLSLRPPPQSS